MDLLQWVLIVWAIGTVLTFPRTYWEIRDRPPMRRVPHDCAVAVWRSINWPFIVAGNHIWGK